MTATPGASKPATDLVAAVRALLGGGSHALDAPALRTALADLHEFWLTTKAAELGITETSGFAIVATGSLGRGEMLPYSDLDLMLLYEESDQEVVSGIAESLWYPLWDANIRLDHSVRTVPEALRVASTDLTAALGLLEARHIAGDAELSQLLIGGARRQWRSGITGRFAELVETTQGRWSRCGEIAHRAEPDLKNGRGGLRDTQLLSALALTQLADVYPTSSSASPTGTLHDAHQALLNVRTELHRISGRGRDILLAQHADEIGAALRIGDRFDLARLLSDSARTVSYYVDSGVRTAGNALPKRGFAALRRPVRRPLDEGVVEYNGEVMLARDARPERDPGLILRVAAASALTGLPMATATLTRLVDSAPELRAPWPQAALKDLLVLLSTGPAAVNTIEALDRTGLWGRLFPEWGAVRDLPPRDVIHMWTVDRHLAETVSRAGAFTTRVARPDLLVLAALLHDIGKGRGGDHSVVGAELAAQVGTRLGLWPSDIKVLTAAVRHHLLLVSTATRKDLQDPAVITAVVEAIEGDSGLLELLHALAEADSLATGPGVWGDWKAALIGDLVRRCRLVMAGEPLPQADPIDPQVLELAAAGEPGRVHVTMTGPDRTGAYTVTVLAPDRRGALSRSAGVLALNALRVCSASVNSAGGHALDTFVVTPHFGAPPAAELLRQQLALALGGELDVAEALRRRDREAIGRSVAAPRAAVPVNPPAAPPRILWHDGADPGQRLVEVRATDAPGLLTALTGEFERAGVDVAWAKVTTLGSSVIDVFAVALPAGDEGEAARARLEAQLYAVLPAPTPAKPVEQAS